MRKNEQKKENFIFKLNKDRLISLKYLKVNYMNLKTMTFIKF